MNKIDEVSDLLAKDVYSFLKDWMKETYAEETDFHRYRMKLLSFAQLDQPTSKDCILKLMKRIDTPYQKDVEEFLHEKIMGETMARYIWAKIIIHLNDQYEKILDFEIDRVKAETAELKKRSGVLTGKISAH